MSKPTRSQVLAHLQVAGYHGDIPGFLRLYVENRISKAAADAAYEAGRQARKAGMGCTCAGCKVAA